MSCVNITISKKKHTEMTDLIETQQQDIDKYRNRIRLLEDKINNKFDVVQKTIDVRS